VVRLDKLRTAVIVLLVIGLGAAGFVGYRLFTEDTGHAPPSSRVSGTTDDGWQQVTYRGVTVELPPSWKRLDTAICEVPRERWSIAGQAPCDGDGGLTFLASATFDPATGPGVHTSPPSGAFPAGAWMGYVTRGDVVVNVLDPDQAVVRRVLQSVSETI
jgi:hypothetical protein